MRGGAGDGTKGKESKGLLAGRFRPRFLLANHDGVKTWHAVDERDEHEVVVKSCARRAMPPRLRERIAGEAELARELLHPSLVKLEWWGDDGEAFFWMRPYVKGTSLAELQGDKVLSPRECLVMMRGVLIALAALHERGLCHRNLKPENLIVTELVPEPVLVDAGLGRNGEMPLARGDARYLAPEQRGGMEGGADARADLYAFGAVLRALLDRAPASVAGVGVTIPRALDELLRRLLAEEPRDRYQSAPEVLAELDLIIATFACEPSELVQAIEEEPPFVGRAAELARLMSFCAQAKAGDGGLSLLEAESGGGKTRLLDELAVAAEGRGCLVLRACAAGEGAPRPLAMLEGIVNAFRAVFAKNTALGEVIKDRLLTLGSSPEVITQPLRDVVAHKSAAEVIAIMRAFLRALGSEEHPVLVILDDAQWTDALTLELLGSLAARSARGMDEALHAAVVVAFHSEEVPDGHLLRRLRVREHLALYPLARGEVVELCSSIAGSRLPDEAIEIVMRLSAGNPFEAIEAVRGMIEGGALVGHAARWRIDVAAMRALEGSRDRVARLPAPLCRLLAASAVIGMEFDLREVAAVAELELAEAIALFAEARRRKIISVNEDEARGGFVHQRLRAAVLARVSVEGRRALHLAAARRGEREGMDVFDLAYHFDAAGEHTAALPHALQAAREALARNAPVVAESYYRFAAKPSVGVPEAVRLQIAEGLGEILLRQGRREEARTQLEEGLNVAERGVDRARLEGRLVELELADKDVAAARARNLRALSTLGICSPRHPYLFLPRLFWQAVIHVLRKVAPRRRPLPSGGREYTLSLLLAQALRVHRCGAHSLFTWWLFLLLANLTAKFLPTRELAAAYLCLGSLLESLPSVVMRPRLLRDAERCERELSSAMGQVLVLELSGMICYANAEYRESYKRLRDAAHTLEGAGDHATAARCRLGVALSLYRLGQMREATEAAEWAYRAGAAIDDVLIVARALDLWVKSSGGRVATELLAAELANPHACEYSRMVIMQAEGVRLILQRRFGEAALALGEAEAAGRRLGYWAEEAVSVVCWRATALRGQIAQTPGYDAAKRARLVHELDRTTRRAVKLARRARRDFSYALRERALCLAAAGKKEAALAALDLGIALVVKTKAAFEHALSLLVRGQLALLDDDAQGDKDLCVAGRMLLDLGAEWALDLDERAAGSAASKEATPSLLDRFRGVLECGRSIASALTEEAIFLAVQEAVLVLLRPESWAVLRAPSDDTSPLEVLGGEYDKASRELIDKAFALGKPVVASDVMTSEVLAERGRARSVICAPIFARGRPVACFYATHEHLPELFGGEELRLAEHVATLAGAALENAAGFAHIEALSRSLEQRVEERTAALAAANRALDDKVQELFATHADLVRAEKLAFAGGLASGIAHEINNPLAAMRANIEVLRDYAAQTGELWRAAKDAASFLRQRDDSRAVALAAALLGGEDTLEREQTISEVADIVNDMLDSAQRIADLVVGFRRLASTEESSTTQTVTLEPLLRECLDGLKKSPRAAAVPFVITLSRLQVVAVAADLRVAMSNVLACAIEHFISAKDAARGRIVVFGGEDEQGAFVRIAISSLYLTEAERARLFDPHVALDALETQRMRLDLRLAIAYQLLRRMSASLLVDSDEATGTTFTIRFGHQV